jgi:nucleotide-binding universal stress UspA family protein
MASSKAVHPSRHGVLVATDLGFTGADAVTHGAAWARRLNVPLVVAHAIGTSDAIVPLLPHLAEGLPRVETLEKIGEAVKNHVRQWAPSQAENVDVALDFGAPDKVIVALSRTLEPRVLVVGASRKGTLEHVLLGSTADQILRHAEVPVLVARGPLRDGPILVATNFADGRLTAEWAAAEFAKAWNRDLILVHGLDVSTPIAATFEPATTIDATTVESLRGAAEAMARSCLERVGVDARVQIVIGDPARVVVDEAVRVGASLIVVSSHGREGLSRLTHGSAAEGIVRHAPCPVLVTHLVAE